MGNNSTFIITDKKETAGVLLAAGFVLIDSNENTWVFLNEEKANFNFANVSVVFSNVLTF